jgi:outer membrane protein
VKKATNITVAVALASCLTVTNASADMVLGLFAGVQGWNMDAEGTFGTTTNQSGFNFEDESQASFYVALEHPVPLVPNIKIKHNQMDTNGITTLTSTYTFNDTNFAVASSLVTDVDLKNTDFIFYYEVLDNDLVTFDFGLNIKRVDGQIDVVDVNDPTVRATESFDGYVPMFYGAVKVGLPFTGLGVFADGSILSIGDHTLYDYEAGIEYTFEGVIDLTLQVGYRAVRLELDDLDDIYSDLDFDGAFVGLEAHF